MSNVIHSYGNEQAEEDGVFQNITPPSQAKKGWKWLITQGVAEHQFSMAAFQDLYNALVARHNKGEDTYIVNYVVNGVRLWCSFEDHWPNEDIKVFKVILPSEY